MARILSLNTRGDWTWKQVGFLSKLIRRFCPAHVCENENGGGRGAISDWIFDL